MMNFKSFKNLILIPLFIILNNNAYSQCDQYLFLVDNSGTVTDAEYVIFSGMINASIDALASSCNATVAIVNYGGIDGEEIDYFSPFGDPSSTPDLTVGDRLGNLGDDLDHAIGLINTELALGSAGALANDPTCNTHLVLFTDATGGAQCVGAPFVNAESCILDGLGGLGSATAFAASPFVSSLVVRTDDSNAAELSNYTNPAGNEIVITLDGSTNPSDVASSVVSAVACIPMVAVPTLGEWTLIILGFLLSIVAFVALTNVKDIKFSHS